MGILDLFLVASMPLLKVIIITGVGLYLALDFTNILGDDSRKQLNRVVYFVFNPALVGSNLSKTVTFDSILHLWFMPLNVLITFIIGSALGWLLVKITNAPQHLKGLILGCCAAGNLGNLPLIIIPAVCTESGSPFGEPHACHTYGMAYASLSMATGAVFLWSYVYNIVRISSNNIIKQANIDDDTAETSKLLQQTIIPCIISVEKPYPSSFPSTVSVLDIIKQYLRMISRKINLKAVFAPSTTGAMVGFIIGTFPQIRKLLIGGNAPLRVVQDSASLLGDAAIPTVTLIMGANLLKGLKGSGIQVSLVVGIIAVRYLFLPMLGIVIIKGAIHYGLVHSDPLYQFVLLLQYTLPPAMNIGTITQLFGAGESECSVIMLWTYSLASISLTLWATFFMWFTFVTAVLLFLTSRVTGASLNDEHGKESMYLGSYYCYVVKPGVFTIGSVLSLISVALGTNYYLTLGSTKNDNDPQGNIAPNERGMV